MDKIEQQKIEDLNLAKKEFNERFSILKKAKDSLFKLFRQKLEEKKIEEIKRNI
jgi:hypothetical protein